MPKPGERPGPPVERPNCQRCVRKLAGQPCPADCWQAFQSWANFNRFVERVRADYLEAQRKGEVNRP